MFQAQARQPGDPSHRRGFLELLHLVFFFSGSLIALMGQLLPGSARFLRRIPTLLLLLGGSGLLCAERYHAGATQQQHRKQI